MGKVVESGTLAELRHLTRTSITAEIARPDAGLAGLPGVHDVVATDGRVTFAVDGDHLDGAVRHLAELGVRALTSHPPTLEQLLLRHYGEQAPIEET
jgi:ABC-2 type transport system ATP-binding protein